MKIAIANHVVKNLTFGSDPEFMVLDTKENRIVSAIPLIKHNKNKKIILDNAELFYDNVLAEMNLKPGDSKENVIKLFRNGFQSVARHLGKRYKLVPQASHTFTEKDCDHDDARLFGCDPEFCAYAVETCFPPDCTNTFRSAGGHIHLGRKDYKDFMVKMDGELVTDDEGRCMIDFDRCEGVTLIDPASKIAIIRLMDIFVGATIALIDNDSTSVARKKLYGKAGRHRPTDYGVEYRSCGNYWLRSPKLVELIYDLSAYVVAIACDEELTNSILNKFDSDKVRETIDNGNKKDALAILRDVELPSGYLKRIESFVSPREYSFYSEWNIQS